ncbi:MAG: methyltransferase domain-containing protein [Pseudomonadota bacterium]
MTSRVDVWNARHAEGKPGEAAWVLREHAHLLPGSGEALDLACGLGANALFMAERGLRVRAWDSSPVAIARLQGMACARGLEIAASVRDVVADPPAPECFDVIAVSHFLDRDLFPALLAALRPGGLLFYQTFTVERDGDGDAPANPAFLLEPNELLERCRALRLLAYREDGTAGDRSRGMRALAVLVGMKP